MITAGFVFCSEIRLAFASRPPIDSYQSRPRAGNSPQKRLSLATGDGLRLRADVVQHRHLLDRPYKDHGGVLLVAFVLPIMIRAGDLVPLPQPKLQASRDVHFEAGRSRQADWISRGGKCTELLRRKVASFAERKRPGARSGSHVSTPPPSYFVILPRAGLLGVLIVECLPSAPIARSAPSGKRTIWLVTSIFRSRNPRTWQRGGEAFFRAR